LSQSLAHQDDHFQRVKDIALKIAENYQVDQEVLGRAALLHDIDQPPEKKHEHVELSLKKADEILKNNPKKEKILQVIREHSTEKITGNSSIESKILFDADKLDGLGPIGIARVFLYCGECGMTLKQAVKWYKKKIKIAMQNLQTPEGIKIAKEKLKFTNEFLTKVSG
jgi:uncharacterized protein